MKTISILLGFFAVITLCAAHTASAYTPPSLPPPTKNVYEIIASNKKLSKFTSMIDQAGLKETLSANAGESVTVFAPTNEALENAPHDEMKRIEGSKENLQSFVKYHIIAGSMVSSGAIKGRRSAPATANGESLSFDGMDQKNLKVGDGTLVQADVMATNGIIHIVSTALVPASLNQAPAPAPAPLPAPTPVPIHNTAAPTAPMAPTPPVAPSAVQITTTGVAKSPVATTGAIKTGSKAASVTTSGVAKPPASAMEAVTSGAAVPITTSGGGDIIPAAPTPSSAASPLPQTTTGTSGSFELFGHKFGW